MFAVHRLLSRTLLPALVPLVLLVGGCRDRDNSALEVVVIDTPAEQEPDAATAMRGVAGRLVRAATSEGLVAFDAEGRVVPALADRWIITDDGQSYIFRLRDGNWRNADELTAASARAALLQAFDRIKGTPLERDLAGIDEIRVMAGRVIEIRLKQPMPYLLQILALPELGLVHDKQGAGPMRIVDAAEQAAAAGAAQEGEGIAAKAPAGDAKTDGSVEELTPIAPPKLGLPAVDSWEERTRPVRLHVLTAAEAVRQFNAGKVDLVLGGHIQDFLLTRSVGILRGTIQLDPVVGLFGLHVMTDKGFLSEPANREAMAMAIDRKALVDSFGVGGWQATTRVVSPSLEGDLGTIGERWSEQSIEERRDVAAQRVRTWMAEHQADTRTSRPGEIRVKPQQDETRADGAGDEGTANASLPVPDYTPEVSIWLPKGEGSSILFARLSADLAAISVRLERVEARDKADLVLLDDVARYPRATWFLNRLSCAAGPGLCSAEADARVEEAAKASTPADRAALLSEAEAELTAANVFIPFGTPIRWSLVRGSVRGFATNSWGWHPLMPLSWLPK